MQARSPSRAPVASVLAASVLAATTLAALGACSSKPDAAAAAEATPQNVTLTAAQLQHIQLVTVARADFRKTVEAAGVVDFDNDQSTSVTSPISGLVTRLLVSPGQKVAAGQALAMVDSSDFAAATSAYAKALATSRTTRQLADTDKELAQHNGVSAREAQQAETDAVNAAADRDAALQALQALKLDPKAIRDIQAGRPISHIEGVIRAPIAGTVVEKLITPGQLLQAGTTPAFTVADLSKVWVMAQIAASDVAAVQVGDPADIDTGVGPKMTGVVDNLAALVSPDTRAVSARVVVVNPGGLLKKQMYVRVLLHSRQASSGLLTPVSSILRDDENLPFVYVAQGRGFARRRVTLGYRTGDQYEITGGLAAGDRVVADGGIFVQFMQSQ